MLCWMQIVINDECQSTFLFSKVMEYGLAQKLLFLQYISKNKKINSLFLFNENTNLKKLKQITQRNIKVDIFLNIK